MKACKRITLCIILAATAPSLANSATGLSVSHHEPLARLSFSKNGEPIEAAATVTGPVRFTFDALGRSFDLRLEPNHGLLAAEARAGLPNGVGVYRGQLVGVPDSWVRIVIADGSPRGLIFDGSEMIAIEAPGGNAFESDEPVVYRLADTFMDPGAMTCGSSQPMTDGAAMYKSMLTELKTTISRAEGAVSEITFGAIGDFEFVTAKGSGADAAIISRLNIVDGIYSEQLGVQITVQTLETFSDANDPFSDTIAADTLLQELGTYRQNTPAQNAQGLTHLFTGRTLETSTVGVAFGNALCSAFGGAGLTQSTHTEMTDALIAAHEIGHNFGAPHDGQSGSPCVSEPQTYIMAPSISGSTQFSACSIAEMLPNIADAPCISLLPSVDVSIQLRDRQPSVLLGNRVALEFDVSNNGTIDATNVIADITLPGNLTFGSSAVTAGSCVDGTGTVSCTIGDVAGLSNAVVTVTATGTTIATEALGASVSADVDEVPGNDQDTVSVTVIPAVNLVVDSPASAQIMLDQATSVTTTVENQSSLAATNAALSISLDSGLRADSATWSIGTCTVAAQQVDCQASTMAAQSISTLSITMTGTISGTQGYSVSASADEADAYMPDNNISGTVTVNTPSDGGEEESGSGAFDYVLLCLLGWVGLLRRRQR